MAVEDHLKKARALFEAGHIGDEAPQHIMDVRNALSATYLDLPDEVGNATALLGVCRFVAHYINYICAPADDGSPSPIDNQAEALSIVTLLIGVEAGLVMLGEDQIIGAPKAGPQILTPDGKPWEKH